MQAIHAHDAVDLGTGVRGVGHDAHLRTRMADGRDAQRLHRHGEHGNRHLLARGEKHVHLAGRRVGVDRVGKVKQVVGIVSHGGDHRDDLVARLVPAHQTKPLTFLMCSGLATELPPNLATTRAMHVPFEYPL